MESICPGIELVRSDLLSDDGWDDAVKGVQYVIHTASPFVIGACPPWQAPIWIGARKMLASPSRCRETMHAIAAPPAAPGVKDEDVLVKPAVEGTRRVVTAAAKAGALTSTRDHFARKTQFYELTSSAAPRTTSAAPNLCCCRRGPKARAHLLRRFNLVGEKYASSPEIRCFGFRGVTSA